MAYLCFCGLWMALAVLKRLVKRRTKFTNSMSLKACVFVCCRYKPTPEEVAASCDVTFAMLADPQSAVRIICCSFLKITFWCLSCLTLFHISWMLLVGSMELRMEWVQGKGAIFKLNFNFNVSCILLQFDR